MLREAPFSLLQYSIFHTFSQNKYNQIDKCKELDECEQSFEPVNFYDSLTTFCFTSLRKSGVEALEWLFRKIFARMED